MSAGLGFPGHSETQNNFKGNQIPYASKLHFIYSVHSSKIKILFTSNEDVMDCPFSQPRISTRKKVKLSWVWTALYLWLWYSGFGAEQPKHARSSCEQHELSHSPSCAWREMKKGDWIWSSLLLYGMSKQCVWHSTEVGKSIFNKLPP
jgi:hypothetical protein